MTPQAPWDSPMTSYIVPKKMMEVDPKPSIMSELKRKAAADKSDKTVEDLIWLLYGRSGWSSTASASISGRQVSAGIYWIDVVQVLDVKIVLKCQELDIL